MVQDEGRLPAAVQRLREVGRGSALGALAIGMATILGIVARVDVLTAPLAGRPRMSTMAAAAFTLAATAALIGGPSASRARRAARGALGAAVLALGAAALADNTLDVWPSVGMPSVPASIGLIVLGVAIVLVDRASRGGKRPADVLAGAAGFIGLVTLLGHTFHATELYSPAAAPAHGTSLGGSVCLCLLSVAILCARPAEGLVGLLASPTGGGTSARRLGLAVLVMIPGLGLLVAAAQHFLGFEERAAFSLVVATATALGLALIAHTSADIDRSAQELARASAAEHRLRIQIEAMARASDAMSQAVARMEGPDVGPVLREIAEQAQRIAGAEYAAVGIASEDDPGSFARFVTAGVPEGAPRGLRGHPTDATGVLGDVALRGKSGRTCRVAEYADSMRMPPTHPPITSLLSVPLTFAGLQIGSLLLGNKRGEAEFTEDDRRTLEMLAAPAASALRAARLHEVEALAREWLQTVIDQIPEPILIADAGMRNLTWNRAAADVRGCDDAVDERGNPAVLDIRLPSGDPVPSHAGPLARALERGETTTGVELLLKTHNDTSRPVIASAAPLRDRDGQIRGAVALFDDVTALKRLERLREEWTAVVSHDLRNPLSSLLMCVAMLRRSMEKRGLAEDLSLAERAERNANRMAAMIEELTEATTLEAKGITLRREPSDLRALLARVVGRMDDARALRITVEAEDSPSSFVLGDPSRLERVIANLLTNALKYSADDAPVLARLARRGDNVELEVTDRGIGIAPESLTRLFDRYYRTTAGKARAGGLGLGLYIARLIVEAHGGRIDVVSEVGQGSTFRMILAAHVASA